MTRSSKLPRGVKVIIGFHLCSFVLWFFGQSMAVVAYDTVADWGLQGPRDLLDPVIVEVNRGIGLTDTLMRLALGLRSNSMVPTLLSSTVFDFGFNI